MTKFGINYGAGSKLRMASVFGLRFDVRQNNTGKHITFHNQSGWLNQLEASVGAVFLF